MRKRRLVPVLLPIVLIIIVLFRWFSAGEHNRPGNRQNNKVRSEQSGPAELDQRGGLNRDASALIYSKHARCRMGCREISEGEVVDILKHGEINYSKSDLRADPDPKYALEGTTGDGQQVRIIFANSPRGIVVVTVIDLENEWKCDCK